jgi:hypothetical protein
VTVQLLSSHLLTCISLPFTQTARKALDSPLLLRMRALAEAHAARGSSSSSSSTGSGGDGCAGGGGGNAAPGTQAAAAVELARGMARWEAKALSEGLPLPQGLLPDVAAIIARALCPE